MTSAPTDVALPSTRSMGFTCTKRSIGRTGKLAAISWALAWAIVTTVACSSATPTPPPDPGAVDWSGISETTVENLIEIRSAADAQAKVDRLVDYIWGASGFPSNQQPDLVEEAIRDEKYADLPNLRQINRLTIDMDYGVQSIAYHFLPKAGRGELVVYHEGHDGDFFLSKPVIARLLQEGYAVLAFDMPLIGMNAQPQVELERFGPIKLTHHGQLPLLPLEAGHAIKFFLQPVAVGLNYAQRFGYGRTSMVGISGGGWTTTLYSAIDDRISKSFPVAGSLPIYLRGWRDWGDYEQTVPELYTIANYPELYVLGALGKGRQQLQILNQYDPCCFAGSGYQTYEGAVRERVAALGGGDFRVYLDSGNHEHKISDQALDEIVKALAE